jgi:hypothetical protein
MSTAMQGVYPEYLYIHNCLLGKVLPLVVGMLNPLPKYAWWGKLSQTIFSPTVQTFLVKAFHLKAFHLK